MASPITKNSGVDNIDSRIPGTTEVWWYSKRAYIKHGTATVVSNDGVPTNSQAFKIGLEIALNSWNKGTK